jgi:hypothetical protein
MSIIIIIFVTLLLLLMLFNTHWPACVCVYYCSTYYKVVRVCVCLLLQYLLQSCSRGGGTHEEPGNLTQGGALFSLVPLVWESNPKLQGGWCKPNHQPIRGFDPNHQGNWSPPRAGQLLFITAVPNTKLCAWGEEDRGEHVL